MTDIITDMDTVTEEDFGGVEWADTVTGRIPEGRTLADVDPMDRVEQESLRPKFDSVAAFKLWRFSLDGGQDEDHGDAVDWHRWSALFRDVTGSLSEPVVGRPAAILHTDAQGFVTADWYADGADAEKAWADLEKEWDRYDTGCGGHVDDDAALTSGAGIGEAVRCDGSCKG